MRGKFGSYHHELSLEVVQGCLCLGIIPKLLFGSSYHIFNDKFLNI